MPPIKDENGKEDVIKESPPVDESLSPVPPVAENSKDNKHSYEELEKMYKDSSREGREQKERAEQLATDLESVRSWQRQAMPVIEAIAADEELLKNIEKRMTGDGKKSMSSLSDDDRRLLEEVRQERQTLQKMKEEEIRTTAHKFIESRKVDDPEERKALIRFAQKFDGEVNPKTGKSYDVRSALDAAYLVLHPESIADTAKLEQLAALDKRNSASESMDADGSSNDRHDGPGLTADELAMVEKLRSVGSNITPERYAKRKAQLTS